MLERAHVWTEDAFAEAREMWGDGRSITEIASFFSISRSAVAGFISRNRDVFAPRTMGRPVTPKTRKDGKPHTIWTEDRLDTASRLWSEGFSTREIGERMGVSKSSMHDLAHRNRDRFPKRITIKKKPLPKVNLEALFVAAGSSSPYDGRRFIISGQQPVAFASLKATGCKFPVSAPDEPCGPEMLCCGAERLTGRPYCAAHAKIARRPA